MQPDRAYDDLQGHKRMRACLEGIRHLDPDGVAKRIAEFDREIAHLETLLGDLPQPRLLRRPMEIVEISRGRLRAA